MTVADYTIRSITAYHKRNERVHLRIDRNDYIFLLNKYGENMNFQGYIKELIEKDLQTDPFSKPYPPFKVFRCPLNSNDDISKMLILKNGTTLKIAEHYGCNKEKVSLPNYIRHLIKEDL